MDGREVADALARQHRRAVRPGEHPGRLQRRRARAPGPRLRRAPSLPAPAEHLERLYARMLNNGSAPGTVRQAHRTIRTALNEAVRRGYLARNPATLAKALQPDSPEVVSYSLAEVRRLLATAQSRRNSARCAIALARGLRQGEARGLKGPDVNLAASTLAVRRGRQRPGYTHGCGGDCGRPSGYCPERRSARPDTAGTKSRNGRRVIGLPLELVSLLRQHWDEQDRERDAAAELWHDGGWVFASPTGQPPQAPTTTSGSGYCAPRVSGTAGCTTPAYRGNRPARPRRTGTRRARPDGLFARCPGRSLPTPHRRHPARRRPANRRPPLGQRRPAQRGKDEGDDGAAGMRVPA